MSTEPEQQQPAYQNYPAMPSAQPGPWAGVKPGVNGFAVASLVLGIVGFVGAVLSVIFGIVALVDIRRTRQRGKGLAISGIVLSGVWVVAVLVFAGAAFVAGVRQASSQSSASSVGFQLKPGQCFDRAEGSQTAAVTVRDCAQPHDAEAFPVQRVNSSTYPGVNAVMGIGEQMCPADSAKWLTPGLNYPDIAVHYLYPEEQSWSLGDQNVICFYRNADGHKMTGHAKDGGLPYTDDQKRYLAIVGPYYKIADEETAAQGQPWTVEHDLAVRSIPVLQQEIAALNAGPWPPVVETMAQLLAQEKGKELQFRQQAVDATNQGDMFNALGSAKIVSGDDVDVQLRQQLHLPPR